MARNQKFVEVIVKLTVKEYEELARHSVDVDGSSLVRSMMGLDPQPTVLTLVSPFVGRENCDSPEVPGSEADMIWHENNTCDV